jgi:cardiolipin synthase
MNNGLASNDFSSKQPNVTKHAIETILGLPFTENNKVRILKTGKETFQTILNAVSSAQKIICIEFYLFKDDNSGRQLAELLKKKAAEGVSVYLLYDHFGSFLTSRSFWLDLKKEGVKVRVSHPFKWSSPREYIYRNHKKLLVIDGQIAFTGGFNIADEYHGYFKKRKTVWRDTGIYLEGLIASTLLGIFSKSWRTWKGEVISLQIEHKPVDHGVSVIPIFANSGRARRRMRKLLLHSIRHSKESILLTTAYFVPGRKTSRALISAVQRGVKLKLLLPGESDVMPVFYASRSYYNRLLKEGVEIYNYQGAVLHSKTAVFDGCWSIVGSANIDFQSLGRNDESNVGVFDYNFSRNMMEVFYKDLENSVKIDPQTWRNRPFYQKFLEKFFFAIVRKL